MPIEPDSAREPFQFGLRTLLVVVAACGLLLAIMDRLGFVAATLVGWMMALIAAHVIANRWGTRAAREASRRLARGQGDGGGSPTGEPPIVVFAPLSRLRDRTRLGWTVLLPIGAGAIGGGAWGTMVLAQVNQGKLRLAGLTVVAISCTVIGAFLAFLSSSFLDMSVRAMLQARREPPPSTAPGASVAARPLEEAGVELSTPASPESR